MKLIKKKSVCIILLLMMLMLPVCAAYASEYETSAADGNLENEVMPMSLHYLSMITAGIQHDPDDTGFFWCTGSAINYHSTNYRITITLRLLQSYAVSPNGQWTELGKWSEFFYLPGDHDTYFIYRGYYQLGRSYCTENRTEVYKAKTDTVIETATVQSYSMYVSRGKGGIK